MNGIEQLELSKSSSELPDAVVKHARGLAFRAGDDDIVKVVLAPWAGGCLRWS
jgi:hypothetical protein